jgi:Rab guanine nucleotide exchange factor SEC2
MARTEDTEEDAQTLLVNSLRAQLSELGTQVTQLNSKLVSSYNRISDLEDDLHESKDSLTQANSRLKDLEEKVGSHQNALLTGSLVNREEITAELSRLMETATEEASQRGLAEEAKNHIEREIGDLSESLFAEANKMVLAAKAEQDKSERRMHEMEKEVRMAESAVAALQAQLQEKINIAQACKEELNLKATPPEIRRVMLNERTSPYFQFIGLIDHIRSQKLTAITLAPTLSSLLSQPFIARLVLEDS